MPDAGSAVHFGREKKLVDCYIVKSGMLRFSFMVECCRPGLFPDAPLLAAMLNLVSFINIMCLSCRMEVNSDWHSFIDEL